MSQFNFKLQRVLEIKEHKEELLKNELVQARKAYQNERKVLAELEESKEKHLSDFDRAQNKKSILIEDLRVRLNYIRKLADDLVSQSQRVQNASKREEEVREKLIEASQEKRVLERLKEKHYKEFNLEEEKKEQETLDEIALSMYFRDASQLSLKK